MKVNPKRFKTAISMFPKVPPVLARLNAEKIPYSIGGSLALYAQGHSRLPHDVDIMFMSDAHDRANEVFGLSTEIIERPNVTMHKSTPVDDESLDFLSRYNVIADGVVYSNPPMQKVSVEFDGKQINLMPAEKIVAFKLISRREHHHDLTDVKELLNHPDFDEALFWEMVDVLDARSAVTNLINNLVKK
jgi:hypothetical protein